MWLLIFLLFPFIELYLLIKFAIWFGFLNLVIEIISTAIIGVLILQIAQSSLIENLTSILFKRSLPAEQISDDLFLCLSAGLLIAPGILLDILAIILLIPSVRKKSIQYLSSKIKPQKSSNIIEGEFYESPNQKLP